MGKYDQSIWYVCMKFLESKFYIFKTSFSLFIALMVLVYSFDMYFVRFAPLSCPIVLVLPLFSAYLFVYALWVWVYSMAGVYIENTIQKCCPLTILKTIFFSCSIFACVLGIMLGPHACTACVQPWLSWNSRSRAEWPWTHRTPAWLQH